MNIVEQVVEEVHVVAETQQSEAYPSSDHQESAQTQSLPSSSLSPSPSSPPPHQLETELPKALPSPGEAAAEDTSSSRPPPPAAAEPSSDLLIDPNTNADISADSGNAPEPASPTSHSSPESPSR